MIETVTIIYCRVMSHNEPQLRNSNHLLVFQTLQVNQAALPLFMGLTWKSSVVSHGWCWPLLRVHLFCPQGSDCHSLRPPSLTMASVQLSSRSMPRPQMQPGRLGLRTPPSCFHLLSLQISSLSYGEMSRGHGCHDGDRGRACGTRVIIVATLGNIIYHRNQSPTHYHFFPSEVCHGVLIDLLPLSEGQVHGLIKGNFLNGSLLSPQSTGPLLRVLCT